MLIWAVLLLGTMGMALAYLPLFFIGHCFAQSALVSCLRGKAIAFTPRVDENKRVVWQCGSAEIPAPVLPPECHQ